MEKDLFSTSQKVNFWLFADMLDGKRRMFEYVESQIYKGKNSTEIPIIVLLGSAIDKRNDGQSLTGEFFLSVWNVTPTDKFKEKYPSWKDVKAPLKLELWIDKDKILCEESGQTEIPTA